MRDEHMVYFKMIRKGETKLLRGVIYLEHNEKPTAQDYERCLVDCGHDVVLEDPVKFIFKAFKDGETYTIDVLEEYESPTRDVVVENLAATFIKKETPL